MPAPLGTLVPFALALAAVSPAVAQTFPGPLAAGTPNGFAVRRGTNVSHWLSQSQRRGEERRRFFSREDVVLAATLGFDHLRIPVDEEQLFDEAGRPIEEAFGLLDAALDWCAEQKLRAIVDLHILRSHHFNEGDKPLWREAAAQERFLGLWRTLSARLARRPADRVAYELMNEPVARDPEDWNRLVARAVEVLRAREPRRTLVIGSNMWQTADTFDRLAVPAGDPNVLLSFHFYTPMPLTHYGAGWTKVGEYKGPVRYPGEVVAKADMAGLPDDLVVAIGRRDRYFDRSLLEERIAKPIALARASGLPLYCGEWGALPSVPRADRLRWYADFRAVLEKYGIGWATWDWKGGFGVVDRERKVDEGLAAVLLASPSVEPIRSAGLGAFETENEIGDVKLAGATVFDSGRDEYRLTGAGFNIWGPADAFHFAWKRTTGDVDLAAAVRFVGEGKNAHRKAGLMVRASLAPDAAYVHAAVHGDGLVSLQYREAPGGETKEVKASLSAVPALLVLSRRGDEYVLLAGHPGEPPQRVASIRLSLPAAAHSGLTVCSHEADRLETAVFSLVRVE